MNLHGDNEEPNEAPQDVADLDEQWRAAMQEMGDDLSMGSVSSEGDLCHSDMHISPQERQWATQLKELHAAVDGSIPVSDMEYAQHAIVSGGDMEGALRKLDAMQAFRKTYHVQDTVQACVASIEQFIQTQPRFLVNLEVLGGYYRRMGPRCL